MPDVLPVNHPTNGVQTLNENKNKQNNKQGNCSNQTLPALCNPTIPLAADRPHCLRPEIFRMLFALAWHTERSLLLHDITGD